MSMEVQFLYEDVRGDRQRASFTDETFASYFRRKHIEQRPDRELLVETHDYRRGDIA